MDRYLISSVVTLQATFSVDGTGSVVTAPSVTITRADGTVLAGPTAAQGGAGGVVTFTLTPAQVPQLEQLTAVWSGVVNGQTQTIKTQAEIVGGFLCPVVRLAAVLPGVAVAEVERIRIEAEQRIERACRTAFVRRYAREALPIVRSQLRTRAYLRSVRAITVAGVAYTAPELAALTVNAFPGAIRGLTTTSATEAIVGYEHGVDFPPEDITRAVLLYAMEKYSPDADDGRVIRSEADSMAVTYARPSSDASFITPELNQIVKDNALPALPTLG